MGTPTTPPNASRRNLLLVVGAGAIALAALAAAVIVLVGQSAGGAGLSLNADPVRPERAAPVTRGSNYDGRPLVVPTPGRPALVTFLFADCPDICPAIAATIRGALDRAGPEADAVDVVAVSVDPVGDTPDAVRGFVDKLGLAGRMDYLIGTRAELEPLWQAWLVAGQPEGQPMSAHSARVVLVDRDGRQVGSYAGGVQVPMADLAQDILTLAREG